MLCYVCKDSQTTAYMKHVDTFWFLFLKSLLQMNSNSLVNEQKQTNKQNEDWVSKLNCKTEFFVPYNGHQNCLNKYLIR